MGRQPLCSKLHLLNFLFETGCLLKYWVSLVPRWCHCKHSNWKFFPRFVDDNEVLTSIFRSPYRALVIFYNYILFSVLFGNNHSKWLKQVTKGVSPSSPKKSLSRVSRSPPPAPLYKNTKSFNLVLFQTNGVTPKTTKSITDRARGRTKGSWAGQGPCSSNLIVAREKCMLETFLLFYMSMNRKRQC